MISGLNTAGPRIAPNTEPTSTSAIPRARRSGGYMSAAAVRASSAVPDAIPTHTSPASTATGAPALRPQRRERAAQRAHDEAGRQDRDPPAPVHRAARRQRGKRAGGEHDRRSQPEQPADADDLDQRDRGDRRR